MAVVPSGGGGGYVSYLLMNAFANVWLPYTVREDYTQSFGDEEILGLMRVIAMAPSAKEKSRCNADS